MVWGAMSFCIELKADLIHKGTTRFLRTVLNLRRICWEGGMATTLFSRIMVLPVIQLESFNNGRRRMNFQCLEWPPQLPGLHPIEILWQIVKIEPRNKHSHSLLELEHNVKTVWDSVRPGSYKKTCYKHVTKDSSCNKG